jgi:nucleotide-binding universal stress UspA family protein
VPVTGETTTPILLCYDGSEDARKAVEFAGDRFAGRRAVVVTAWEPYLPVFTGAPGWPVTGDEPMKDNAARLAAEGCERARAGRLDASPRVQQADDGVARALLDAADDEDADLIVMGTRGLTGVQRLLLGSVAHAVVQHAHRPVAIVPSRALAEARAVVRAR